MSYLLTRAKDNISAFLIDKGTRIGWLYFSKDGVDLTINTVHVHPRHRGKGIATQMLSIAMSIFKESASEDTQSFIVTANILGGAENKECIKLFKNKGFTIDIQECTATATKMCQTH